jgi:DamX protein
LIHAAENHLLSPVRAVKRASTGFPVRNILGLAAIATVVIMLGIYQLGRDEVEQAPVESLASSVTTEKTPEVAVFPAETQLDIAPPPASGKSDFNYPSEVASPPTDPVAQTPVVANAGYVVPAVKPIETVEAVTEPIKAIAKPVASPKKLATQAYTADESALLAAKGGYIVQLLGSYQEAGADGFKAEWQAKVTGNLYRYKTSYKGRDWYVVVAGVYSSRGEVTAAVNLLPSALRKQSPWIRPVSAVQDVLR